MSSNKIAFLHIYPEGGADKVTYDLKEGEYVIGTASTCDIILDLKNLAARHCRITASKDGQHKIEDLGGQFGVFRVTATQPRQKLRANTKFDLAPNTTFFLANKHKCVFEPCSSEQAPQDSGTKNTNTSQIKEKPNGNGLNTYQQADAFQATLVLPDHEEVKTNYTSHLSPSRNSHLADAPTQLLGNDDDIQATLVLPEVNHDNYNTGAKKSPNNLFVSSRTEFQATLILPETDIQATLVLPEHNEDYDSGNKNQGNQLRAPASNMDNLATQILHGGDDDFAATLVLPEHNEDYEQDNRNKGNFLRPAANMDNLTTQILQPEEEEIGATLILPEEREEEFPVPKTKPRQNAWNSNMANAATQLLGSGMEEEFQSTLVLPDHEEYHAPQSTGNGFLRPNNNIADLPTQLVDNGDDHFEATLVLPEHHDNFPVPQKPKTLSAAEKMNIENLQTQLLDEGEEFPSTMILPEHDYQAPEPKLNAMNRADLANAATQLCDDYEEENRLPQQNAQRNSTSNLLAPPKAGARYPTLTVSKPTVDLANAPTQLVDNEDYEAPSARTAHTSAFDLANAATQLCDDFEEPAVPARNNQRAAVDLANAPTQIAEEEEYEAPPARTNNAAAFDLANAATQLCDDYDEAPAPVRGNQRPAMDLANAPTQIAGEEEDYAPPQPKKVVGRAAAPPVDLANAATQLCDDNDDYEAPAVRGNHGVAADLANAPTQLVEEEKDMLFAPTLMDDGRSGGYLSPVASPGNSRSMNLSETRQSGSGQKKNFMSVPVLGVTQKTDANDLLDLFNDDAVEERKPTFSNENSNRSLLRGNNTKPETEEKKPVLLMVENLKKKQAEEAKKAEERATQSTTGSQASQGLISASQEEEKETGRKKKVVRGGKTEKKEEMEEEKAPTTGRRPTAASRRNEAAATQIIAETQPIDEEEEEEEEKVPARRTRGQAKKEEKKEKKPSKIASKQAARTKKKPRVEESDEESDEEEEEGSEEEEEEEEEEVRRPRTRGRPKKDERKASLEEEEKQSTVSKRRKIADEKTNKKGAKKNDDAMEEESQYRVLLTGFDKNDKNVESLKVVLSLLGVTVVEEKEKDFNILVMDEFKRTIKFMLAVDKGIDIVNTKWIHDSGKARKILPPSDYTYSDPTSEAKYKFQLKKSLEAAKKRKGKKGIFDGYRVHIPNKIKPSFEEVKTLIESANGTIETSRPHVYESDMLIILNEDDKKAAKFFKDQGYTPYTTELVFAGVLQQKLNLKSNKISA